MKIDVALLPEELKGRHLGDTVCIVLDIFRATSSITTAIANGCQAILPAWSEEDAKEAKAAAGLPPIRRAATRANDVPSAESRRKPPACVIDSSA